MNSRLPASIDPTGAPRPFERQNITESTFSATSRGGVPRYVAALKIRASVHMNRDTSLVRLIADLVQDLLRIDVSAEDIVAIFHCDQCNAVEVVALATDQGLDSVPVEDAVRCGDRPRHTPGKLSHAADLVQDDVRALMNDDLVATLRMRPDRALVPHCPGRHEDRGFLPDDFGRQRFQSIDARVFVINVVADFSFEHGLTHRRGRACDGVASQIDELSHSTFLSSH